LTSENRSIKTIAVLLLVACSVAGIWAYVDYRNQSTNSQELEVVIDAINTGNFEVSEGTCKNLRTDPKIEGDKVVLRARSDLAQDLRDNFGDLVEVDDSGPWILPACINP
jgi:hypothetical protein